MTCTYPPVVLNSGDSRGMWVTATISKAAQQRLGKCSINNDAVISKPLGSPQNSIAGDDAASAEALTPGENCEPIGGDTDLSIKKESQGCYPY